MKPKTIVTALLLAFVGVSVVVAIVRELGPSGKVEAGSGRKIVAYYLHGMKRCDGCRRIEAAAHDAVAQGFTDELKGGRLEWRVANYEAPGNDHFAKDYGVMTSTVVLIELVDGKQAAWKNLEDDVWDHVNDRDGLMRVVHERVTAMLREG